MTMPGYAQGIASFGPHRTLDHLVDELVRWLNAEGIAVPNVRIEMTHSAVPIGFAGPQSTNTGEVLGMTHFFFALVAWTRP
jgi:hypothetical protein